MFNQEFFPTPSHVIEQMCEGLTMANKTILEPSAGKGDIVDHLTFAGAEVLTCEINEDLAKILKTKSRFLKPDFFSVTSEEISHISAIVMNPPFSNADKHILHAYNIAPSGCKIIALCNSATLKNRYPTSREQLASIIETNGQTIELGNVFGESERRTDVNVSLISINKPGADYKTEFEGFFMDEEPEQQGEGIIKYDFIRDIVGRYVGAIQIFDEQIQAGIKMNRTLSGFLQVFF